MGLFGKPNIGKLKADGKVKKLIKILSGGKYSELQAFAAEALGELGDARAVESLLDAVDTGDEPLQFAAVRALGKIGDAEAADYLLIHLKQAASEDLQVALLKALGGIRAKKAADSIVTMLPIAPDKVKTAAAEALGDIGDPAAVEPLSKAVWTDSAKLKMAIIKAMREIGGSGAVKTLMEVHKAGSPEIREAAASALARLGYKPDKTKADNWVLEEEAEEELTFNVPHKMMELIKGKGDLPAIPEIVIRLSQKLNEPDCTLRDVAELIKIDSALTARVIQVANSAYYARSGVSITDIQTAVTRLGIFAMRNIVFAFSILKQFKTTKLIDQRQFWIHSFVTAQLARNILSLMNYREEVQERAYMAGLMHDIGIMVMMHLMPDAYEGFLKMVVGDHSDDARFRLEREESNSFRTDHAEVGAAYVHHWWPVDEAIVKAVLQHHRKPDSKDFPALSLIVIHANEYANGMGIGNGVRVKLQPHPFDNERFRALGMTEEQINRFADTVGENVEIAKMILELS